MSQILVQSSMVFLTFRGGETRDKALHVYETLNRQGFNVFMDEKSIPTGQDIKVSINEAINNSTAAVIILSEKLAGSEWCLDELNLILERKRKLGSGYILHPIYVHGVDPGDVKKQKGSYGNELAKHDQKGSYLNWKQKHKVKQWRAALKEIADYKRKVKQWRAALTEIAGYKGNCFNGTWSEVINEMVKEIRQEFVKLGIIVKPPISAQKMSQILEQSSMVFLSFRGAETRDKALHVYETLNLQGFNVFMDDKSIPTGQHIEVSLKEAINNSTAAVIILSEKFAESKWCLNELILILERKKKLGDRYILHPIYVHGVDPDDVREQKGSYGVELAKHDQKGSYLNWKQKRKVKQWRAALTEIAGYRGKCFSGTWPEFINEMVKEIRQEFFVQLDIIVKPRKEFQISKLIDKLTTIGTHVCENYYYVE